VKVNEERVKSSLEDVSSAKLEKRKTRACPIRGCVSADRPRGLAEMDDQIMAFSSQNGSTAEAIAGNLQQASSQRRLLLSQLLSDHYETTALFPAVEFGFELYGFIVRVQGLPVAD
jgi:hypothetical protein